MVKRVIFQISLSGETFGNGDRYRDYGMDKNTERDMGLVNLLDALTSIFCKKISLLFCVKPESRMPTHSLPQTQGNYFIVKGNKNLCCSCSN